MNITDKLPVFDAHTHVYPDKIADRASVALGKFYSLHIDAKGTVADLVARCKATGVNGILLLGVATSAEQLSNVNRYLRAAIDYATEQGIEAYAFGGYHQDADPSAAVEEIMSLGLSGIKIHPDIQRVDIDDPRIVQLCKLIEGKLPINFHMGDPRKEYSFSRPEKLMKLLDICPDLTVIASHLGGYHCWDRVESLYSGCKNVYFDTSSSIEYMPPERAEQIIRTLGVDRIFFGTDYPLRTQSEGLVVLDKLRLTDEERYKLMWGNFHKFLISRVRTKK